MLTQVVECTILHTYAILYNHIYWIVIIKQNLCINIIYVLTVVILHQGHCKLLLSSIVMQLHITKTYKCLIKSEPYNHRTLLYVSTKYCSLLNKQWSNWLCFNRICTIRYISPTPKTRQTINCSHTKISKALLSPKCAII